jgi:methylsterol monooxygenase
MCRGGILLLSPSHAYTLAVQECPQGKLRASHFLEITNFMKFTLTRSRHDVLICAQVHHEFHAPIALAAVYAHPVEVVIGNVMSVGMGPFLCNSHLSTFYIFLPFGILGTQMGHCGYKLPLQSYSIEFHDFHHSANTGNFGSHSGILDWLHGTDSQWREATRKAKPVTGMLE